ncbi:MAG: hypothetical protein G01um101448_602 [Parcubacteria group bacterium Gr01-1014_48]|nr:MAG: hypothetical protein Greene041614_469 [Parcubacteria group bacterium Greene0416_14]TSC73713.1 MAG: hypothetical protein G01um101448_602 [Parcubacteria group bacterium Gr01-1014_48]
MGEGIPRPDPENIGSEEQKILESARRYEDTKPPLSEPPQDGGVP